jgi:tRNA (cmo5U34)-methyltransferase
MVKDEILYKKKFEFNKGVSSVFSNMLERSIPEYEKLRELVYKISLRFQVDRTHIVDLGASTGLSLEKIINAFKNKNKYIAVECSKSMVAELNKKFKSEIKSGMMFVENKDLRHDYPVSISSIVYSIFTIQFIPLEYRQGLIEKIYKSLTTGGCFVFVEKVLGESSHLNSIFIDEYLEYKKQNNYSDEQIERKKIALEGVLVPLTASWNVSLLKDAGFRFVDCFWRYLNFCGWIAVK